MLIQSRLLGDLTKSAGGNARAEPNDSMVEVPSAFLNMLNIPIPLQEVYQSTQSGKTINSTFFISYEYQYNINPGTLAIVTLAAGLWEITWSLRKRIAGAVSDNTSFTSLGFNLLDGGTNPGTQLANLNNGQTLPEGDRGTFIVLIPKPNTIQINNTNSVGLGTGLNLAFVSIFGNRRF